MTAPRRRAWRQARPALVALWTLFLTSPLQGQAPDQGFEEWLNATIDAIVATRLEQTSSSKQVEAPSALGSSTSLVDNASVSDLVGLALTPPTLPRGRTGDAEATSQAFTLSPYAIISALTGQDPDDPYYYQEKTAWRLLGITLGTEDVDDPSGPNDRALLVGVKLKVWDRRSAEPDPSVLQELRNNTLPRAGAAFGRISGAIQDELAALSGVGDDLSAIVAFTAPLNDPAEFAQVMGALSDAERANLVSIVEAEIEPFLALDQAAEELVANLRGEPQLALAFSGRASRTGRDSYRVGVALDRDLAPGLAWTLNGSLEIKEAMGAFDEGYGATFATQLSFALADESLTEARGARLTLAAEGSFMQDADSQARLQAKLVLPLTAGLEFPISVTWANRTDLIDEEDVSGHIGITMDTASLLRALGG